jgi:hypothetical protein
MWGKWNFVEVRGYESDRTAWWYITSEKIFWCAPSGSKIDYTREASVVKESENVIKLNTRSETFWLYPKSRPNAGFSGNIVNLTADPSASISNGFPISRAAIGFGNIQTVISNLNDAAQTSTAKTDENGNFTAYDIIPGDTYSVTVENNTVEVTPSDDGVNIGTITLTDGLNFKVSGTSNSKLMLADGTTYTCTLSVKNIGTVTATACSYQITGDEGESYDGILGSIAPGKAGVINISNLKCGVITTEKKFKTLHIVINDPINHKTWNDSVSFLFYKSTITLTAFKKGQGISGVIIDPDGISYCFGLRADNQIIVPRLHGDYLIAITGSQGENVYGIDISIFSSHVTQTQFNSESATFTETGSYEPNNTEGSAKLITAPVMSYFHEGDLDYYLINVE